MAKLSKDELIISIHAPTRGATDMTGRFNETHVQFQSTLPREERPVNLNFCELYIKISIHAPTRGATHTNYKRLHNHIYFNPRSHERSDTDWRKSTEL